MAKLHDTEGMKIEVRERRKYVGEGGRLPPPRGDGNDNARQAKPIPYQDQLRYKDTPQPAKDSPFAGKQNQDLLRAESPPPFSHPGCARGTNRPGAEGRRIHTGPPTLGVAPPRETLAAVALHVHTLKENEEEMQWDIVAKRSNVELPR